MVLASQQRHARRRPERTSLYQVVARRLESWFAEHDQCGRPIRQSTGDNLAVTDISGRNRAADLRLCTGRRDGGVAGQARSRLGSVSFQRRSGSSLNLRVLLHACVTDGVFEQPVAGGGVTFHTARLLSVEDLVKVTQLVQRRLVRWSCRKGFLSHEAASDMLTWQHSGFSIDASVRILLADRDMPEHYRSMEHLLRYCARPAFAEQTVKIVVRC